MKKLLLYLLCLFPFLPCLSQEEKPINLVYQSTMLGVGSTSVYDTYLSPMEYKGTTLGLFHEQIKMTGIMGGRVSAQHLFNLAFAWADNDTKTASDYTGFMEYNYGLHYRFSPVKNLQLFTGAQADGMLGFIYNSRNGNNPATGKANVNLNLSGIAAYQFQLKSQPIKFRYQVDVPFLGLMYSPHFGQSYYEMGLGDDEDLVHFSSFNNQLSLRNILSLEFPFNSMTLRLTYMNTIYETDVNYLKTRIHSNSFYLGFSKNFFSVPGKKRAKGNYNSVFE